KPFNRWESSSWIRNKPVRTGDFDGLPFASSLVPLAEHRLIRENEPARLRLLAYRLLAHLQFTTLLELRHINPVCASLVNGEGLWELTSEQRNDALRIYCDEGG